MGWVEDNLPGPVAEAERLYARRMLAHRLRTIHKLTYREIAWKLGVSPGRVEQLVRDAERQRQSEASRRNRGDFVAGPAARWAAEVTWLRELYEKDQRAAAADKERSRRAAAAAARLDRAATITPEHIATLLNDLDKEERWSVLSEVVRLVVLDMPGRVPLACKLAGDLCHWALAEPPG